MYLITEIADENDYSETANVAMDTTPLESAHYRFGHLHVAALKELWKQGLLPELNANDFTKGIKKCAACGLGKMTRQPYIAEMAAMKRTATKKGEMIHMDSSGKMAVPSLGYLYYLLFIDDYTRKFWVRFMKNKSESYQHFKEFYESEIKAKGYVLRQLRSDDAPEFTSTEFRDFCTIRGIMRRITPRYTPQQNAIAERGMRTIGEMARTLLAHSGLGKEWWAYAVKYAVYTRIRCPTSTLENRIPFEEWSEERVNSALLKPFGSRVLVYVPDTLRTKWDMKGEHGIFVGVDEARSCYTVYLTARKRVCYSRDVQFYDDVIGELMESPGINTSIRTTPDLKGDKQAAAAEVKGNMQRERKQVQDEKKQVQEERKQVQKDQKDIKKQHQQQKKEIRQQLMALKAQTDQRKQTVEVHAEMKEDTVKETTPVTKSGLSAKVSHKIEAVSNTKEMKRKATIKPAMELTIQPAMEVIPESEYKVKTSRSGRVYRTNLSTNKMKRMVA